MGTGCVTLPCQDRGADRVLKSLWVHHSPSPNRRLENSHPLLTRFFKLQFFYVPVKRSHGTSSSASPSSLSQASPLPADSLKHPSPTVCPKPLAKWNWKGE